MPYPQKKIDGHYVKHRSQRCHALNDIGNSLGLDGVQCPEKSRKERNSAGEAFIRYSAGRCAVKPEKAEEEKKCGDAMDGYVDEVVSPNIFVIPVPVECKGEVSYGTIKEFFAGYNGVGKKSGNQCGRPEIRNMQRLVGQDIIKVIKMPGSLKGIGVRKKNGCYNYNEGEECCAKTVGVLKDHCK